MRNSQVSTFHSLGAAPMTSRQLLMTSCTKWRIKRHWPLALAAYYGLCFTGGLSVVTSSCSPSASSHDCLPILPLCVSRRSKKAINRVNGSVAAPVAKLAIYPFRKPGASVTGKKMSGHHVVKAKSNEFMNPVVMARSCRSCAVTSAIHAYHSACGAYVVPRM